MDCSLVSPPKDATPPNFTEKTFANSYKKPLNSRKFSPSKVSRYTVQDAAEHILLPSQGGTLCIKYTRAIDMHHSICITSTEVYWMDEYDVGNQQ